LPKALAILVILAKLEKYMLQQFGKALGKI
jgi:hypothetical protein